MFRLILCGLRIPGTDYPAPPMQHTNVHTAGQYIPFWFTRDTDTSLFTKDWSVVTNFIRPDSLSSLQFFPKTDMDWIEFTLWDELNKDTDINK